MGHNEAFRQFARENRKRAEAAGIGLDSKLSRITPYSLEEPLGRKLTPFEEGLPPYTNAGEILGERKNSWYRMPPDELIEAAAILLSIDMPIEVKTILWRQLYAHILAMNRDFAESRGIGKDSHLSTKTFYGFEELAERKMTVYEFYEAHRELFPIGYHFGD